MTAYLVLAAAPTSQRRLRQFFNPTAGIAQLMSAPPVTRQYGFGIAARGYAALSDDSQYWESRTDVRRLLHLYADGTLIFRAIGTSEYLCWPPDGIPVRVNPTVVCECALSFALFYRTLLPLFTEKVDSLFMRIEVRDGISDGRALLLTKGGVMGSSWQLGEPSHVVCAGNADASLTVTASEVQDRPATVAHMLAAKFYELFDYDVDAVPYTSVSDGKPYIEVGLFGKE